MNLVLFLGAGFSAPFGHPVMSSFFQSLDNVVALSKNDRKIVDELRLSARAADSFLRSDPNNLEDILSFAIMADLLRLGNKPILLSKELSRILGAVYTNITDIDKYWKICKKFDGLINHQLLRDYSSLSIITTNYDVNIECSLLSLGKTASLNFEHEQLITPDYQYKKLMYSKEGIPLYKLHGSVNWFPNKKEGGSIGVEGRVMQSWSLRSDNNEKQLIPTICHKTFFRNINPEIIPPSFLKPNLSPYIRKIWKGAAKALNSADKVVFVGYSFPDTDTNMRYFLANSLINNPRLNDISIIDINTKPIKEKLIGDRGKYGSHFQSFLNFYEDSWEFFK